MRGILIHLSRISLKVCVAMFLLKSLRIFSCWEDHRRFVALIGIIGFVGSKGDHLRSEVEIEMQSDFCSCFSLWDFFWSIVDGFSVSRLLLTVVFSGSSISNSLFFLPFLLWLFFCFRKKKVPEVDIWWYLGNSCSELGLQ